MKTAAHNFAKPNLGWLNESVRERDRELLELRIECRVRRLEVAAARLWLQLVKTSDASPVGWLNRADDWPPASRD